jgi:hypothetical protein
MWRFVVALTIAAACGCGKDTKEPTKGPTTSAEVGTYALVSLNGGAVPTSISEGGTQVEVISGILTLSAGGTVRISTTFRISPGAEPVTNVVNGTYSMQEKTLSFSYNNGGRNTGTLNGDTLQMLNEGVVWLYQRA